MEQYHFQTIESILKLSGGVKCGCTWRNFQTIESILKLLLHGCQEEQIQEFPDYWVYFKAGSSAGMDEFARKNFQTIESILKPTKRTHQDTLRILFPDYWVYFKAERLNGIYVIGDEFPDYWVYFKAGRAIYFYVIELIISRLLSLF